MVETSRIVVYNKIYEVFFGIFLSKRIVHFAYA